MPNFRDLIIDRVEELLVWGPDNTARDINQSLLLQESGSTLPNTALSRSSYTNDVIQYGTNIPRNGYFSRVWKVDTRPTHPTNIVTSKLVPSVFIYTNSGSRPANVATALDSLSESLLVGIDVVLVEGFGVQRDAPNQNDAQSITEQVNAFVIDFDVLFSGNHLKTTDFSSLSNQYGVTANRIGVQDALIADWAVGQEVDAQGKATDYEILTFSLQITLVYPRALRTAMMP